MFEVKLQDPEKYKWKLRFVLNTVCASGAAIFKALDHDNILAQGWTITSQTAYYRSQPELGVQQFHYWLSTNKHDYKKMITFFNMQNNNRAVKEGQKLILNAIALNQKLFVPMIARELDIREAASYDSLSDETLDALIANPEQLDLDPPYLYHTNKAQHQPHREVMIRLLSPYKLDHIDFASRKVSAPATQIRKAIIHFHGGGFVCQDSASHQCYTRQWANEVNVPVFSVDYRLSPGNPFPDPINDCYQAYVWIVTQAEKQLGMKLEHIILAGDSAGGHLAITVAMLAVLRGFRRPDGLLVHYPVFSVGPKFYPSCLLSLDEELLSQPFLKFVMACFLRKGGDPDKNPLASPVCASDKLLNCLPKMVIFASECDVLRDHSIMFMDRLLKADRLQSSERCKMYFMREYIHGFCSMDTKHVGVDEFQNGTQITCAQFRLMFMSFEPLQETQIGQATFNVV